MVPLAAENPASQGPAPQLPAPRDNGALCPCAPINVYLYAR